MTNAPEHPAVRTWEPTPQGPCSIKYPHMHGAGGPYGYRPCEGAVSDPFAGIDENTEADARRPAVS